MKAITEKQRKEGGYKWRGWTEIRTQKSSGLFLTSGFGHVSRVREQRGKPDDVVVSTYNNVTTHYLFFMYIGCLVFLIQASTENGKTITH
jgi:hypothetical protein